MNKVIKRFDRSFDQLRTVNVTLHFSGYAAGSVLFEIGKTKVLCAVTMQRGVPHFLRGTKTGWLTAEYAMLPTSTSIRSVRESSSVKRNGRSVEISRLIGRSLRSVVSLAQLGEYTITIDCDVLQADGGTRTACITGAYLALREAEKRWLESGAITTPILTGGVAAISVGLVQDAVRLDLDFIEDSHADADFNFVLTSMGNIVEIQGSSERCSISWDVFERIKQLAVTGINDLFSTIDQKTQKKISKQEKTVQTMKQPLFCLKNR